MWEPPFQVEPFLLPTLAAPLCYKLLYLLDGHCNTMMMKDEFQLFSLISYYKDEWVFDCCRIKGVNLM